LSIRKAASYARTAVHRVADSILQKI